MGEEGYSLHQEIASSERKHAMNPVPSDTAKKSTKSENDFILGVSSSDFVKSILMTPTNQKNRSQPEQNTASATEVTMNHVPKGSIAAHVALKKSSKTLNEDKTPEPPLGGIAALAAQAALKKSQKTLDEEDTPEPPPGEIAALTAQAALKKSQKTLVEEGAGEPPLAGIAALAAQAALKKSQKILDEEDTPEPPPGEIAALAVQTAFKKSEEQSPDEIEWIPNPEPPPGGIAALAAQAALKKSQEQSPKDVQIPPSGGIAALAVQAALEKSKKTLDEEDTPEPPLRGIAALAAQAALKKSEEQSPKEIEWIPNPEPPPGGIAALAAQAALKKSQQQSPKEIKIPPPGGIAALAAQAALKKSQKASEEDTPELPSGGIAALAAEPALKNSQEQSPKEIRIPPPGGIAALAAQAGLKKSKEKFTEVDVRKTPIGGIATLAANAALKKSESGKRTVDTLNTSKMSDGVNDLNNGSYSMTTLIAAVFEEGILDAISNPRDVPAFCCLHLLASSLQKPVSSLPPSQRDKEVMPYTEISTFSRRLLLRCLSISNQATSIGMIGWLEYGSSNLIDRALNLPLEVLQQLSCNMAAEKDWAKASDVLSSLLLRCEQSLPRCHPTTICSMLDLAGALSETQNIDSAKFLISQALDLVTTFLSEAESLFFDRRYFELYCNDPSHHRIVFFDDCVDAVGIMKAFSKQFNENLSRDFLEHLGRKHPITLLNHSLVADSFLVLANCISASEEKIDTNNPANAATHRGRSRAGQSSRSFWSLAHSHYDIALRGWISVESLIHPNAASITFSIARCLRELGRLQQAVKLLETLASCLEQKLDDQLDNQIIMAKTKATCATKTSKAQFDENSLSAKRIFIPLSKEDRTSSSLSYSKDSRPSFLSRRRLDSTSAPVLVPETIETLSYEREQTAALCFWMMAVLTAEQNSDELGRNRALSLLHTASLTLQRVLSKNSSSNGSNKLDDQTRLICLDLYKQIEGEALDLFEPLERIPLVKDFKVKHNETGNSTDSSPRKQRAPWEILTPMRSKRQWTSPRGRINRNRAATASGTNNDNNNITATAIDFTKKQGRESSKNAFIQRL